MQNQCFNGEEIQYRFFDRVANLQWPGGNMVYVITGGKTVNHNLLCNTGATICIGGNQPNHGLIWGVGIDDAEGCSKCCGICTTTTESYAFGCP